MNKNDNKHLTAEDFKAMDLHTCNALIELSMAQDDYKSPQVKQRSIDIAIKSLTIATKIMMEYRK